MLSPIAVDNPGCTLVDTIPPGQTWGAPMASRPLVGERSWTAARGGGASCSSSISFISSTVQVGSALKPMDWACEACNGGSLQSLTLAVKL
jgi:hypothetical protein